MKHIIAVIVLLALLLAVLRLFPSVRQPDMTYSRDIEVIRLFQRKCLQKGGTFEITQAVGGYFVRCNQEEKK